ncbi:MAG: hypothetical protein ACI9MR_000660 [Myxococcota bacterium]|jgi:hypothetical protein
MRDAFRVTRGAVGDALMAPAIKARRGAALLIALAVIAIVGAVSTQFVYHTRSQIWMAGNYATQAKAYFHARSGTKIALLAVNAKKNFPEMQKLLGLLGKSAAQRLEIWPRACDFVKIFATGKAEFFGAAILDFTDEKAVGADSKRDGVPGFSCTVTAEDSRVNLNRGATERPVTATLPTIGGASPPPVSAAPTKQQMAAQQRNATQLYVQLGGLLRPMINSGELDSEESIIDLVLNIIDWTDADDTKSAVSPDGNFTEGTGAEGGDYGQYGYDAKNAKMDTVGEVQLVDGMTSDIYCKIRDNLTVFATSKINVNDADLAVLKGIICTSINDDILRAQLCFVPGPNGITAAVDDALLDLEVCRGIKKQLYSTPFTSMGKFTNFFQQYPKVMQTGIPIPAARNVLTQQLGTTTKMVRIETEGVYGDTKTKMTTIVDRDTGAVVHFHYE